ncbi:hypothetical protein [Actinomadura madurae]|uniref:hypothetical protein n=2 Tax=Actinomadura madurae TaxID=1993 RepID=UPI0020272365|nr:hypothetical protein [Actinomadura madurae]MCP9949245.1 hypothetical protein [Actinomadura madurae]MCQ0009986.1 hypothetical protein [Actinomadura madurae]URM94822.1 hypothetical protein LUW76_11065 [Actinomadura madurae]URN05548.1 hypothetical protein LUW74_21000 [Actinomadura madurae]
MTFQTSALLLSWVAILLLALVVAGLVRQVHALGQGASPRPGPGPAPGTRAPAFERLGPGLLLFLDRDCGVCTDVLAAAGALDHPLHAIFAGPPPDGASRPGMTVLTGEQDGLFADYAVPATPFAVLVGADGRVRSAEPVGSAEALRDLALEGAR